MRVAGIGVLALLVVGLPAGALAAPGEDEEREEREDGFADELARRQLDIGWALTEIARRMQAVEDRLFEADTDELTQEAQRQIVEAMNSGEDTRNALDALIHQIEALPP
jgi:hypothetical protein